MLVPPASYPTRPEHVGVAVAEATVDAVVVDTVGQTPPLLKKVQGLVEDTATLLSAATEYRMQATLGSIAKLKQAVLLLQRVLQAE